MVRFRVRARVWASPPTPVMATTPHVPVIATTPHGPVPAAPVFVAAPYGPIPTVPRSASVYTESNASDRTEKSFHAREQAVYDLERKLIIETQKYETLNQEASIRDLRAVHAEQKRLREVELVNLQAQNNAVANVPQPRQTRFDSHYNQRASTVPPVPATNHSAELQTYLMAWTLRGWPPLVTSIPYLPRCIHPGLFGSIPSLPKIICLPLAYQGRGCPMDGTSRK